MPGCLSEAVLDRLSNLAAWIGLSVPPKLGMKVAALSAIRYARLVIRMAARPALVAPTVRDVAC